MTRGWVKQWRHGSNTQLQEIRMGPTLLRTLGRCSVLCTADNHLGTNKRFRWTSWNRSSSSRRCLHLRWFLIRLRVVLVWLGRASRVARRRIDRCHVWRHGLVSTIWRKGLVKDLTGSQNLARKARWAITASVARCRTWRGRKWKWRKGWFFSRVEVLTSIFNDLCWKDEYTTLQRNKGLAYVPHCASRETSDLRGSLQPLVHCEQNAALQVGMTWLLKFE